MKKNKKSKGFTMFLLAVVIAITATPCFLYLSLNPLTTWAFHLNFKSSGNPNHPDLYGTHDGHDSYFFCLNPGAKAKPEYNYSKRDVDVNYSDGSIEQRRLFWAYIGAWGSFDKKESLAEKFGQPGTKITSNAAKSIAWTKGKSSNGSAWVEMMANDGFMSLKNIPAGCKSPQDIYKAVSQFTADKPLWIGRLQSGPGVIDKRKLYEVAGLTDWDTFRKYCSVSTETPGAHVYMDGDGLWWDFPGMVGGEQRSVDIKVTYDPSVFRTLEVSGSLEYFECDVSGSQQLYRAKGDVRETTPVFYISTTNTPVSGKPDDGSGGGLGGGELRVDIYEHEETFESNYRVELNKYDYETGNPLSNSIWQVLEKFDDGQLSSDETAGGIVEENMRGKPVVWTDWLVFEDDLKTDENGYISYKDRRYYDFSHKYCGGHPIPPKPENPDDLSDEEADDAEAEYESLLEEWQALVDECRIKADSGGGTYHHWECNAEDTPSEGEAFEASGCKAARDAAYETFICLEYSYTFRETDARDGYILHGQNGHPDDVPIEIITTAASEAEQESRWISSENQDITVSGYLRNLIFEDGAVEQEYLDENNNASAGGGHEDSVLELQEEYELSFGQKLMNRFLRFIGLPAMFTEAEKITVRTESSEGNEIMRATDSGASFKRATDSDAIATSSEAWYSYDETYQTDETAAVPEETVNIYSGLDGVIADSQPGADKGPDENTAHRFVVYDHRVSGQVHFNKRDMTLQSGENIHYDSYGESQGDATLEGAVYGLFAADDIYGPDTQRDRDGNVISGIGILFDANDLVSVAATDKNGDGSFITITERPHSTYHYKTGQIVYSGKDYPKNLYGKDGYEKVYPQEMPGRIYKNNVETNGCCWIGRPIMLGNYYIRELSRSEGYELSVTGKDFEVSNTNDAGRAGYGDTEDARTFPKGTAWVSKQLNHGVTFAEENSAYGNRENLLSMEVTSKDAAEGYRIMIDGLMDGAEFYYNGVTVTPVKVQVPDGGSWVDAKEEPLYETAKDDTIFKRSRDGSLIERPGAAPDIPVSYTGTAVEARRITAPGSAIAEDSSGYQAAYMDTEDNFYYIKYELEQMMRSLGMRTPNEGNRYSEPDRPIYDIHTTVNGKEIFGMPEVLLEITDAATNKMIIDSILDYYMKAGIYTYGGLQKLEYLDGRLLATVVVGMNPAKDFLYETDVSGNITAAYLFRLNKDFGRYVIRKYTGAEMKVTGIDSAAGTKYQIRVTPDFQVDDRGEPFDKMMYGSDTRRYLCYQAGDILYDYWYRDDSGSLKGHAPLKRSVYQPNYKEELIEQEEMSASKIPQVNSIEEVADPEGSTFVVFDKISEQYTIHVGTADTDLTGVKTSGFTAALPDGSTEVSEEDIRKIGLRNVWGYKAGDVLNDSEYMIRIAGAGAGAFTAKDFDTEKTYIENRYLIYNGNHNLSEDGNTSESPCRVQERIISQKIKVTKDIDKSSYKGRNTYAEIHEDWFTKIFGGFPERDGGTGNMDNFRFKVYLKSNLTRLYRDQEGQVVWQDRSGTTLGKVLDENRKFPGKANKIFTRAEHDTARLFKNSDDAVKYNKTLYGYTDGFINEEQNDGCTAVLETVGSMENDGGAKLLRYNYDKFFDALAAANGDKWDDNDPAHTSWRPMGNGENTTESAVENSRVSDRVRQFAINWYLEDEIAKLVEPGADGELEKREDQGMSSYSDQIYDEALCKAAGKAQNYLKPFFAYDLDAIYSVSWDGEEYGGSDKDFTTLSADIWFDGTGTDDESGYYFNTSVYLPYGVYVVVEQQPQYSRLGDFKNKHYQIDKPKEVTVPSVYDDYPDGQAGSDAMNPYYNYDAQMEVNEMEQKFHIRFGQEEHVIKGRNQDGDFEVYKYGQDIGRVRNGVPGAVGMNDFFALTQNAWKPAKNYYNEEDDRTSGDIPYYLSEGQSGRAGVSKYYRYSSVSEHAGEKSRRKPEDGKAAEYEECTKTMQGELTAYDRCYGPMFVPWTVIASRNSAKEAQDSFYQGFAYSKFQNRFYSARLRIEKLDAITHENILHDEAVFNIYAAERDDSQDGAGGVRFYEKDTSIVGSREFLNAMGASHIQPFKRLFYPFSAVGSSYSGIVPKGTPVCKESEQIILPDDRGKRTGDFKSFTTMRDGLMKSGSENGQRLYGQQNTGYLELPGPLGAGAYVLCEMKPPSGYARSKPVAVEIYSDEVTYYQEGNQNSRINASIYGGGMSQSLTLETGIRDGDDTARIYVENEPITLTVGKYRESSPDDDLRTVTYRVSGREDGSLTEIGGRGDLEYAYDENGRYLGYGWKKGTLESLMSRKKAGEEVEIVFQGKIFSGYGYVTKTLKSSQESNPFVPGALMTLYDAIELKKSGDSEDFAYEGLQINRNSTGNVTGMYVKKGFAGTKVEFTKEEEMADGAVTNRKPVWTAKTVEREDAPILFYDLDGLDITCTRDIDGHSVLCGYDRDGSRVSIDRLEDDKQNYAKTDTEYSIFAWKDGRPYLEFTGGDFREISYSGIDKSIHTGEGTLVYHINEKGRRDALVDPHTGMAYVMENEKVLVWPVRMAKDGYGNIIAKDKIKTFRIGTIGEYPQEQEEAGFITGSWQPDSGENSHLETSMLLNPDGQNMNDSVILYGNNGRFLKTLKPVYDRYGLIQYYRNGGEYYETGIDLYDRNGDYVRRKETDLLEPYYEASYLSEITAEPAQPEHRYGECYLLENTWLSSELSPNDPFHEEQAEGRADMIKRMPAGTYIMEELKAPPGYVEAMPVGITVFETAKMHESRMEDKTTKTEILKTDCAVKQKYRILDMEQKDAQGEWMPVGITAAGKGTYGYGLVKGADLRLYEAEKIYTSDTDRYPEGYYLKKKDDARDPVLSLTTNGQSAYIEGIPKGCYLLEETKTPSGFVKRSPVEIILTGDARVHTVTMENDHTKLEIEKYIEKDRKKEILPGAEFTLYEAILDENGNVIYHDGEPRYDVNKVLASWQSDDGTDFTETIDFKNYANAEGKEGITGFRSEFERMYKQYGTQPGTGIKWSVERSAERTASSDRVWKLEDGSSVITEGEEILYPETMSEEERKGFSLALKENKGRNNKILWAVEKSAYYIDHHQIDYTAAGENNPPTVFPASAVMTYRTEDGKDIRITIYQEEANRQGRTFTFEYQFDYKKLAGLNDYACSWLTAEGRRRFDYLPVGACYVLAETKVPMGFERAEDKVIIIRETDEIQLYRIKNEERHIWISKVSEGGTQELQGALLALYRQDENGGFTPDACHMVTSWKTGENGRFREAEEINKEVPKGYKKGDLRPHKIKRLPDGVYYAAELYSPDFYTASEALRIDYKQEEEIKIWRMINVPVKGELIIEKQDSGGKGLSGVVVEVKAYRKGSREEVFSKKVGDINGIIILKDLETGEISETGEIIPYTYKVREIIPPDGYEVNTLIHTFEFQPDQQGDSYQPGETAQVRLVIQDEKTGLYIEKRDFDALGDEGTEGIFVEGAELAVYELHGKDEEDHYIYSGEDLVAKWITSGDETRYLLEGLKAGKSYLLKECRAPEGYLVMKPVIFTVSRDGRSIIGISNQWNTIRVNSPQELDYIESLTIKGRYVSKVMMVLENQRGERVAEWISAGNGHVLTPSENIAEGNLYTLTERTLYSDGSEAVTDQSMFRICFDKDGKYRLEDREAVRTDLTLKHDDGFLIKEFSPNELFQEETVRNNVNPENPAIRIKNQGSPAGDALNPGQTVFVSIAYMNTSNIKTDMEITARPDPGFRVIDVTDGWIGSDGIHWSVKEVGPFESGCVTFAAELEDHEAYGVYTSATVKFNQKILTAEKKVPVLRPGKLTIFHELTGSGQWMHEKEESRICIRLFDEQGEELKGRYHYSGSKTGELKSGDVVHLKGNEFIMINPGPVYRNVRYHLERTEDGKDEQYESYGMEGVIDGQSGACARVTRSVSDAADRQLFEKGEGYLLTESTVYSDGQSQESNKLSFMISENGGIGGIGGYDKQGSLDVLKIDGFTGEALPGAVLQMLDDQGRVLEEWISGEQPHRIEAPLKNQATYTIHEKEVPVGFIKTEDLNFVWDQEVTALSVIFENLPKPEEPVEPPEEDPPPIEPEEPQEEEKPPVKPPAPPKEILPPPKPPELPEKAGKIYVSYEAECESPKYRIITPQKHFPWPDTGERGGWLIFAVCFFCSGAVFIIYTRKRKEH